MAYLIKTDWESLTYTAEVYNTDVEWTTAEGHEIVMRSWGKDMLAKGLEWVQKEMEFTGGRINGKWRKKVIVSLTVL